MNLPPLTLTGFSADVVQSVTRWRNLTVRIGNGSPYGRTSKPYQHENGKWFVFRIEPGYSVSRVEVEAPSVELTADDLMEECEVSIGDVYWYTPDALVGVQRKGSNPLASKRNRNRSRDTKFYRADGSLIRAGWKAVKRIGDAQGLCEDQQRLYNMMKRANSAIASGESDPQGIKREYMHTGAWVTGAAESHNK